MDAERYIQSLDRIESDSVRAAFIHLLIEAERFGLTTSTNSGHVYAVRLHNRDGNYVFSYIANAHHLLFYLRNPAFEDHPGLKSAARSSPFEMKSNTIGELTTRVETLEEADKLFSWLKSQISA